MNCLVRFLCCPETKQALRFADQTELEELNGHIACGSMVNKIGKAITTRLEGALIREDGSTAYPIRCNIPILIREEAIPCCFPQSSGLKFLAIAGISSGQVPEFPDI